MPHRKEITQNWNPVGYSGTSSKAVCVVSQEEGTKSKKDGTDKGYKLSVYNQAFGNRTFN